MAFKFGYMVTIDRITDISNVDDHGSEWNLICKNIAFYTFCPKVLWMAYKFVHMVTMERISNVSTFCDLCTIFKVTQKDTVELMV